METKTFTLNELNPAKYNPRTISDEALISLSNSMEVFGYLQPIVVNIRDEKNIIVGGHQRVKALEKNGLKKIECIVVDFDETMEKAANVALNSGQISGEFVPEKLDILLSELKVDFKEFDELRFDTLGEDFKFDCEEKVSTDSAHEGDSDSSDDNYSVLVICQDAQEQIGTAEQLKELGFNLKITG